MMMNYGQQQERRQQQQQQQEISSPVVVFNNNMNMNKTCTTFPRSYQLQEYDVMCGRNGHSEKHSGNHRFRLLIEEWCSSYVCTNKPRLLARDEKKAIVSIILERVQSKGGYFLKQDFEASCLRQMSDRDARGKIAQALRDAGCHLKKKQQEWRESTGGAGRNKYEGAAAAADGAAKKLLQRIQPGGGEHVSVLFPSPEGEHYDIRSKASSLWWGEDEEQSSPPTTADEEREQSRREKGERGDKLLLVRKRPKHVCKPRKKKNPTKVVEHAEDRYPLYSYLDPTEIMLHQHVTAAGLKTPIMHQEQKQQTQEAPQDYRAVKALLVARGREKKAASAPLSMKSKMAASSSPSPPAALGCYGTTSAPTTCGGAAGGTSTQAMGAFDFVAAHREIVLENATLQRQQQDVRNSISSLTPFQEREPSSVFPAFREMVAAPSSYHAVVVSPATSSSSINATMKNNTRNKNLPPFFRSTMTATTNLAMMPATGTTTTHATSFPTQIRCTPPSPYEYKQPGCFGITTTITSQHERVAMRSYPEDRRALPLRWGGAHDEHRQDYYYYLSSSSNNNNPPASGGRSSINDDQKRFLTSTAVTTISTTQERPASYTSTTEGIYREVNHLVDSKKMAAKNHHYFRKNSFSSVFFDDLFPPRTKEEAGYEQEVEEDERISCWI